MSDVYVPLALYLRPVASRAADEPSPAAPLEVPAAPAPPELGEALHAVRRFRAALADALEAATSALLPAIAHEVLARELRLERADVAAIVSAALARFDAGHVLRIRAHPRDCDALAGLELERLADDALEPGNVRIDLRSGTIELSLTARLEAALAGLAE
jgi:flagellar biosynthesis/type III secretory pathway protein FliH